MNLEISNYITEAKKIGLIDSEIKKNLLEAGWEAVEIEDAFVHLKAEQNKPLANKDEDFSVKQTNSLLSQTSHSTSPTAQSTSGKMPSQSLSAQTVNISETTPWYKRKIAFIFPLVLILLASSAFAFYTFVYASPTKIWKKFTEHPLDKIFSNVLDFAYNDEIKNTEGDFDNLPIKDIKLKFSGNVYSDLSQPENPQNSSDINYTFSSGNTSFSTGVAYKLIGKKFYLNVGDNPYLSAILSQIGNGKKIEWMAIDLAEIEKKATSKNSQDVQKFKEVFNQEFVNDLKKIWENAVFVKMEKFVGREKINNTQTLHFTNTLDKLALETTFNSIVDKIISAMKKADEKITDEQQNLIKTAIREIVAKIEINNFETWVGIKDFRLYKIKLQTNAPSVASVIKQAMGEARNSSRDARRLADIRQMASALELYFNDKGKYPESKDGMPLGINPTYIGVIPSAPTSADGNCTDYYNTYWYEQKNKGSSYEYTFCVGKNVGGYPAGILKLTPAGIAEVKDCPSTPDKCYKSGSKVSDTEVISTEPTNDEAKLKEMIEKIEFSAQINIESTYSNYGVSQPLTAPEGAFDLMELLNNNQGNLME